VTGWASALLRVHLACALSATALFWLAASMPKGGPAHRRAGRWFSRLIYAAGITGGLLAVATLLAPSWVHLPDPALDEAARAAATRQTRRLMWLVLYVLVIVLAPVQHGLAVVAAGPRPPAMRTWPHASLSLAAMLGTVILLPLIVVWQEPTWLVLAPLGFAIGVRQLAYAARPAATPVEWQREHLTSLITAGVALHTTLFVFAVSRTLQWSLPGWRAWLPWVVPVLVGLPIMAWLRARHGRDGPGPSRHRDARA